MLKVSTIAYAQSQLKKAISDYGCKYGNLLRQKFDMDLNQTTGQNKEYEFISPSISRGRILACDIYSNIDVPGFDRSTVDGFAVKSSDIFSASASLPAMLRFDGDIVMGEVSKTALKPGSCQGVATGGALPQNADAVVMLEDVESIDDGYRYITKPVSPGHNLIFRGDDIKKDELLLQQGTFLQPHQIGALSALGLEYVPVYRKLKIGLISTGDELVKAGEKIDEGQIYDVNTPMLTSMLTAPCTEIFFYGIVKDEKNALLDTISKAHQKCDLIVISGGSSAGERDHVAAAINSFGSPGIIQHGLAVKPGKPSLIGLINQVPVIGLPGHPVAAWFMADQLIRPLILQLTNRAVRERTSVDAVLSRSLPANHGRQSLIAVKLEHDKKNSEQLPTAIPIPSKSGLITTLRQSDGYLSIDRDCEGLEKGCKTKVYLWEDSLI